MTNLEALQAIIPEYTNDNLFEKVMTDRGVTSSATYSSQKDIDMCGSDVCLYLLSLPEFKDGGLIIKYNKSDLIGLRNMLLKKHDEYSDINGDAQW